MPAPRAVARMASAVVALAAIGVATAGCVTMNPTPTAPPAPSASHAPTPKPAPTAHAYVVKPNDTLNRIARRFGITLGQLLTANPQITDPDLLRVGDQLTVPPPTAPDTSPTSGGITDAKDDLVDPAENAITGEGYADIDGLGIRVTRGQVRIEMGLVARPLTHVDPTYEQLTYTVVMDVDDDGQPDYRIKLANDPDGTSGALVPSLEDRHTGTILAGDAFPGSVDLGHDAVIWTIDNDALGGGSRYRIAGKAERSYWPGGRTDPEVESTEDDAPNQQWPRANPRWVELGAPLASPAPAGSPAP